MYILINHVTGDIKQFTEFKNLREWWIKLSIEEALEWGDWLYVQSN